MTTAIVLGGGVGGLLSARVLSERFDEVHVIERGRYPDHPEARKHVPQGWQAHILLAEGYRLFQGWFPDFNARMDALGIGEVDFGTDSVQFLGATSMPREHAGIPMRCATRPILEFTIHQSVKAIPNVHIHEETEATGWVLEDGAVRGVQLAGEGGERALRGDLVVDAGGRSSSTPNWLEAGGFGAVDETTIDAGFGYATGRFRLAHPEAMKGAKLLICNAQAPEWRTLGVVIALGDDTVVACLIGAKGLHPSVETAEFVEHAGRLGSPMIRDALVGAEVVEPLKPYKATANKWRHYERMARWPRNFVALGDSAVMLNPRFGQGMTVAAMGVDALARWIDEQGVAAIGIEAFGPGYQRRLAKALGVPWMIATSDDLTFMPEIRQPLKDRIAGWYFKHLIALSQRDGRVYVRFLRVAQLLDGPLALFAPDLVWRVFKRALVGDPAPAAPQQAPTPT